METLSINSTGKVRTETLNGRTYRVTPMVMLVPGVLNGSKGPLLYPEDEVVNSVDSWNHMPIVVNHPTVNGKAVSARSPDIVEKYGIGYVFNATGNGKLAAEAWIDEEKANEVHSGIVASMDVGKEVELSTGLYSQNEKAEEGATTTNGIGYTHIARNLRPDHLAILPDSVGACSLEDGCGLMVNSGCDCEDQNDCQCKKTNFHLTSNEVSHDELRGMLNKALKSKFTQDEPSAWISEVYDSYIVYWMGDDMYKQSYTYSGESVTLGSEAPQKVMRKTEFVSVSNNEEEPTMAKKELVDDLIANCSCWEEGDRETLNALSDEKVKKLSDAAKAKVEPTENQKTANVVLNQETGRFELVGNQVAPAPKVETAPVVTNSTPPTMEEFLKTVPAEFAQIVQNNLDLEAETRKELCEKIVANEKDDASKAALHQSLDLDNQPLKVLKTLATQVVNSKPSVRMPDSRPSYMLGAGAPATPTSNAKPAEGTSPQEPAKTSIQEMTPPVINWKELAEQIS